jgi:hypothetical protein
MLGISILDTILLYTLAAIGVSVIVNKFYHSIELYFFLWTHNIKYYFPRFYETLYRLTLKINPEKKNEPPVFQEQKVNKSEDEREQEVMSDILSKSKEYYDSMKVFYEYKIKDISDPKLRNKLDQWYKTLTRLVESPETTLSGINDLKKRLYECSDEIFELFENNH